MSGIEKAPEVPAVLTPPVPAAPAAAPPRSVASTGRTRSQTIVKNQDSRQVLIGMGFPKHRAEKALAATGDRGVQVAADWLLAHVYDPELDLPSSRELIVYAYPLGTLGTQIEEFMDSALCQCGRNGAHKSFPHATLCQFFKCEDSKVPYIMHALKCCLEASLPQAPKEIKLKRYMVQGYIGLFLEEEAASWFREVMKKFTSDTRRQGVVVDPHRRQLHVTMAHQYLPEHHGSLEELARAKVDPQAPAKWEMRMYSRDHRLASSEVYKVLYPYSPHKDDELELLEGDYIYVSATDQGQTDSEGWFFGTSHNTGTSGLYPGNYVEKSKDSDCWTLHRSWLVSGGDSLPTSPSKSVRLPSTSRKDPLLRSEDMQLYDNAAGLLPERRNVEELYAKVNKIKRKPKEAKDPSSPNHLPNGTAMEDDNPPPLPPSGPRRLFILRHAERVDVTFGKQWIQLSFDPDGSYHRRNLNMPKEIPKRKGGPIDFTKDSPVTETGLFQARLTGEGMREQGIRISHVFSSPALRCVTTANAILQGLQEPTIRIKIENGMFEWLAWCRGGFPTFLTPGELAKFGLQVDTSYASQVALQDLKPNETHLEFYKRMFNITRLILKTVGANSGNIMFVGHAATLEACTRQLVGAQPRSAQELTKIVQKIPYCGVSVCQESEFGKSSTWDFIDPPIPPLTHAPNIRFDWRCLQLPVWVGLKTDHVLRSSPSAAHRTRQARARGMGNASGRVKCSDGSAGTSGVSMPPITAAPARLPPQAELSTAAKVEDLTNPGDYEEIGKRVKEQLFPQPFEGCKVVIQKGLSKHFQTNHTLTLGPSSSQWNFGATFVGSKKVAENDFRPVLMGELTNSGSFTALLLHQFGSAWRLKCNAQTQQAKWVGYQGTLDYHGADFTASLTVANPDPIAGSAVAVAQYLQALTPSLALGTELLYQVGGGMQNALLSLGGRYKARDWELAARLGLHTWHVTYHHQLKDLVLMAECDGSLMQAESTAAVGYRLELGAMTVRGRVDTRGTVGVGVERRLDPLPATLLLSGQLNHWTDESKFGVAVTVG